MLGDKKEKKEHLGGGNCQDDLWQKSYLGGQIRDTMKNIGKDLKGTEDDRKMDK